MTEGHTGVNHPHLKFDLAKLERLNDPGRFDTLRPDVMWEALGCPTPEVIVEIGAGTGLFAARFAELAPEATVYAADIEPAMVEWMRNNRSEVAHGRIVPMLAEETRVPLRDATGDLVVMINLHHELAEPDATYAEAFRLLRPGGQLLLVDWRRAETPKGPPLSVRASASELVSFLRRAGFADVTCHGELEWHELVTAVKPEAMAAAR